MPGLAAPHGGTAGPGPERGRVGRLLRGLLAAMGLALLGVLAFAVALAVTAPAQVLGSLVTLPPQVEALSGSAWAGRALLAGGHSLSWQATARGAWRLRLGAEVTVEGPGTRLEGRVALTPWGAEALGWTGRAGPGLLALAPRLRVGSCTSRAVVDVPRLGLGRWGAGAEGRVTLAAGTCALDDGGELAVPALALGLSTAGEAARGVLTDEGGATLATAEVRGGAPGERTLRLRVEPEGAALVPGMPASAATEVELPF